MAATLRPSITRQQSRVPGGFDTDDDLSPIKTEYNFDGDESTGAERESRPRTISKADCEVSVLQAQGEDGKSQIVGEASVLEEKEMQRRLMDMDSSFLPQVSPAVPQGRPGVDDTFLFGENRPDPNAITGATEARRAPEGEGRIPEGQAEPNVDTMSDSPVTPPELYQTPAPGFGYDTALGDHANTSSLETMSSSPTVAAAARTVSRVVSMASVAGYETANDRERDISPKTEMESEATENEPPPLKEHLPSVSSSPDASPTLTKSVSVHGPDEAANGDVDDTEFQSPRSRKRPKYLNNRVGSQRSSYSSYTTTSTEGGSEITVGADFALQSGGAVPYGGSMRSRPTRDLSRTISLGSMASGVSTLSDGDDRIRPVNGVLELSTLDEEDDAVSRGATPRARRENSMDPETPVSISRNLNTPTETVIAQHVRDIQVPATMAREFLDRHRQVSPEKKAGPNHRNGKSMTLKEQSSTIDRLVKENWDLKLKIKFLNDNLNRRSDEGVKDIISENVELRTAKFNSAKEIRELKRAMRELERKAKEKADELSGRAEDVSTELTGDAPTSEELRDLESEVTYLRERVMTYEVEIETMRHESSRREGERRRLAKMLDSVGQRGGSDIGAREEIDMWRDLHEAETARREQADDDNRKLREEINRLRNDSSSTTTNNHATNVYHLSRRHRISSTVSQSDKSDRMADRNGVSSASSTTFVEQLRHENAELRSQLGAQTSMLTSRNREKERLYQEIEELKLGSRSVVGDSILERSASRAHGRTTSRGSNVTRATTQLSDAEREGYEIREGELRDLNNALKLELHDISKQLNGVIDELEEVDVIKVENNHLKQAYDDDMGLATQDLQTMQKERDEALRVQEALETGLEGLRAEAEDRIFSMEDEIESRGHDLQTLRNEVSNRLEESDALRNEVRSMSERIVRIGDNMQSKIKTIEDQEIEIEAINRETDAIDKERNEEKSKNARLMVQQESSQNEIAFLREEQDGDKIRIGDLEGKVNATQANLDSEKDRAKDLEERLAEERHQREVIGSKEKKEVQTMINDLNREITTARDELRNTKKSLQSNEIEATTYKERLLELESNLREALGDMNGTRSSFLTSITKLQKELHSTSSDLEIIRSNLDERERLLRNRDALLESHGLESKKLSELLDRERQGRRQDKSQHEQWQKTHQHITRTVTQKDTRITELENRTQSDRKKILVIEQQSKDQLGERNSLLLTLWNRLSVMCGPDWQYQNNLINGHVATLEVVSSMLPGFSKNLLQAVINIEGLMMSYKGQIQNIERDLWKEYQNLESTLEARTKKLDRLENIVQSNRVTGTFSAAPEIAKLRGENRLLKSELAVFQKQEMHARASRSGQRSISGSVSGSIRDLHPNDRAAPPPTLARHHSSSAVETLERATSSAQPPTALVPLSVPIEPSQQRWIHRLRELERRLKAEREARLLDRSGARKRLEEGRAENDELKMELEREKIRRSSSAVK